MAKLSFFTEQDWFKGKVIGNAQFDPFQANVQAALALRALRVDGIGMIGTEGSQATASGVPDLNVNIAAAAYMVPDGKLIGWNASEQVDMSEALEGTLTGPTAAQTAFFKRYVVVAGAHEFIDQDPDTDYDGNPVNFTRLSSSRFGVWMSPDVALADLWPSSTVLHQLITDILAAGQIPICMGVREFGATTLDQAHLFEIYSSSQAHEIQRDQANQLMAELVATSLSLPMVLNSAGQVAITGQAVVGQPGTVTLAGGELVAFCLNGEKGAQNLYRTTDLSKRRIVRKPIPLGTVLTLLAAATEYVVRGKVNPETGEIEVYFGTGSYPNDEADGWNPGNEGFGAQGGTNLGFLNTWGDIALARVFTGALGDTPTVVPIRSDHSGRLAYLNQQAVAVNNKAETTDVQPLTAKYLEQQPYVSPNTLVVAPLTAGAGLNLNVAALKFRGGFHANPPNPFDLALTAQVLALADNTINLIYADPNIAVPVYAFADVGTGGGPVANIDQVILGFVRTSAGSIQQIVYSPMTYGDVRIQDVVFNEAHVNEARELHIGPTVARGIVDDVGVPRGVFKAPWTTHLDESVAVNWDGAVVGGNDFHYVYADPGGSGGASSRNYCMFKLSNTPPNAETGRHPTKPNMVFMFGVYKDGGGQLTSMYRKGDLTIIKEVQVLNAGAAVARTAVGLGSAVPLTATHVRVQVDIAPLATVGAGSVTVELFKESTGVRFARAEASGESGTNATEEYTAGVYDIPIDRTVAAGQIHYLISNASATTSLYVLGWIEGKTQIDPNNVVAY